MKQTRIILAAGLMVSLVSPALADDAAVQAVRQDIARMRQEYEARIQKLERRLALAEAASNQATAAAAKAKQTAEVASRQTAVVVDQTRQTAEITAGQPAARPAESNNAFNPAIGVVLDGTAAVQRRDPSAYQIPGFALGPDARPVERGFALGESEINLSANIDQALYGNLTISYARDNTFSVEEAFIQSSQLPGGFTLKGGRFFSGIGYLNEQHAHTWDFVDAPLPYLAMLNRQYGDDGVQVRWLAPTRMFVELGAEGFRGDAYPANGAANKGFGSYSAFIHIGDDIGEGGEGGSWRIGVSELWTRATDLPSGADRFSGDDRLTIVDGVYKWAPGGNFADRYIKLQGEYFYRAEKGRFNGLADSTQQQGFYTQAVWQFMPQWRVGARYDRLWASTPNAALASSTWDPGGHVSSRESLMIDYFTSEFGRFRLQGNLDHSTRKYDPQLILQYTVSLGAHGAHAY
jgi:hypothetical protein